MQQDKGRGVVSGYAFVTVMNSKLADINESGFTISVTRHKIRKRNIRSVGRKKQRGSDDG